MNTIEYPMATSVTATDFLVTTDGLDELVPKYTPRFLHMLPQKLHHWSYHQKKKKIKKPT